MAGDARDGLRFPRVFLNRWSSEQDIFEALTTISSKGGRTVWFDARRDWSASEDDAEDLAAFVHGFALVAHDLGLRTAVMIPSLDVKVEAGDPRHILLEWSQVTTEGRLLSPDPDEAGGVIVHACPNGPYRRIFLARLARLAASGADDIVLDGPALHGGDEWTCACAACRGRFERWAASRGVAGGFQEQPDLSSPAFRVWLRWRHLDLADFLAEAARVVRSVDPGVRLAVTAPGVHDIRATTSGLDVSFIPVETGVVGFELVKGTVGGTRRTTGEYGPLVPGLRDARLGVWFSPASRDLHDLDSPDGSDFSGHVQGIYPGGPSCDQETHGCRWMKAVQLVDGLGVDFATVGTRGWMGLDGLAMVWLPSVTNLSESQVSALVSFVEQGGFMLATGRVPGDLDEVGRRRGYNPLRRMLGLEEGDDLPVDHAGSFGAGTSVFKIDEPGHDGGGSGRDIRRWIRIHGSVLDVCFWESRTCRSSGAEDTKRLEEAKTAFRTALAAFRDVGLPDPLRHGVLEANRRKDSGRDPGGRWMTAADTGLALQAAACVGDRTAWEELFEFVGNVLFSRCYKTLFAKVDADTGRPLLVQPYPGGPWRNVASPESILEVVAGLLDGAYSFGLVGGVDLAGELMQGLYWTGLTDRVANEPLLPGYGGGVAALAWTWEGIDDLELDPPAVATGTGELDDSLVPVTHQRLEVMAAAASNERWHEALSSSLDLVLDSRITGMEGIHEGLYWSALDTITGAWTGDYLNQSDSRGGMVRSDQVLRTALDLAEVSRSTALDEGRRLAAWVSSWNTLNFYDGWIRTHGRLPFYLEADGSEVPDCLVDSGGPCVYREIEETPSRLAGTCALLSMLAGELGYDRAPSLLADAGCPSAGDVSASIVGGGEFHARDAMLSILALCRAGDAESASHPRGGDSRLYSD